MISPSDILERLGHAIVRDPRRIVLGAVIPCLLLCVVAAFVPRELSFKGFLPADDPRVQQYLALSDELNIAGRASILLEGADDEELLEAALTVERELEALDGVSDVIVEPPAEWFVERAPWFVDDEVFDAWLAAPTQTPLRGLLDEQPAMAVPGARLLAVQLADDPFALKIGVPTYFVVEARGRELAESLGVQLSWAGMAAVSAQDQVATISKVALLTPISLIVVLLLLRFVEPRPKRLVAVALPMLLSLGATVGVVGLVLGKITFLEGTFGIMVFGLGVDFALHLIVRTREERSAGRATEEALPRVLRGAGTGVLAGALTTAGAFAIASLAPDPMARHIGLSGAVGLVLCAVLMLTLLPAIWVLLERRSGEAPAPPLGLPLLRPLVRHATAHPGLHVGLGVLLVVVAVAGAPALRWETDLARVFSRDMPALQTAERIQELFGANSSPWVIPVESLDEARRVTKAFEAEEAFGRVEGIGTLFGADLADREARMQEAVSAGQDPGGALAAALSLGRPTPETLPDEVRRDLVSPTGRYLVYAFSATSHLDGVQAGEERRRAQAIHPGASGFGMLLEILMASERPWMSQVLVGILAFVLVILIVDLRDPRWVIAALAPVVFGTAVTFGILCWADVGFNSVTAVAVPLLLGLGVDDGIHVVHRLREVPAPSIEEGVVSVGRAIVMTTVTSFASFVVMAFSDHPGLESMALVLLIGLPLCLIASITLVPALVVLLRAPRPAAHFVLTHLGA